LSGKSWSATLERLEPFVREHWGVELEAARLARELMPPASVGEAGAYPGDLDHLRKNVFSVLFLAVYDSLDIPAERRAYYGLVNHAVRGLVTATDNILDDEYKAGLPLKIPREAPRFSSVMNLLLFDRIIENVTLEYAGCGSEGLELRCRLQRELLEALYRIGEVEAEEEAGLSRVLEPDEVLSRVHSQKGGNLLKLAFVAPGVFEEGDPAKLEMAARGVYLIGMGLQIIDDVVDLGEDIREGKNNYLLSSLTHDSRGLGKRELIELSDGDEGWRVALAKRPAVVAGVVATAIEEALSGFEHLHKAGFWFDRDTADEFISRLFELRGGEGLLSTLPGKGVAG